MEGQVQAVKLPMEDYFKLNYLFWYNKEGRYILPKNKYILLELEVTQSKYLFHFYQYNT